MDCIFDVVSYSSYVVYGLLFTASSLIVFNASCAVFYGALVGTNVFYLTVIFILWDSCADCVACKLFHFVDVDYLSAYTCAVCTMFNSDICFLSRWKFYCYKINRQPVKLVYGQSRTWCSIYTSSKARSSQSHKIVYKRIRLL